MNDTRQSGQPETLSQFFNQTKRRIARTIRGFVIRRELAAIRYQCECIQRQRMDDFQIERFLVAREVVLRAQLRDE